jgi:hypothetical protein
MGDSGFTGLRSVVCPMLPRVSDERALAIGFKEFREFPALLNAEARTNPDVLQSTGIVKEAQEQ